MNDSERFEGALQYLGYIIEKAERDSVTDTIAYTMRKGFRRVSFYVSLQALADDEAMARIYEQIEAVKP